MIFCMLVVGGWSSLVPALISPACCAQAVEVRVRIDAPTLNDNFALQNPYGRNPS